MELSKELLSLLLPELLITHFEIIEHKIEKKDVHIYFKEKSDHPVEEKDKELIGHGFYNEITIRDFPLRGKSVFLHIKRRRWKNKKSNEIVKRNWELVAQGSRMTVDFAAFLKAISQY